LIVTVSVAALPHTSQTTIVLSAIAAPLVRGPRIAQTRIVPEDAALPAVVHPRNPLEFLEAVLRLDPSDGPGP
jgi:hypothetical protein